MPTPSERVAEAANRILVAGEMGNSGPRRDDYERWLDEAYKGQGKTIRGIATSCAIFAGGCLIHAGVQQPRGIPAARGITTWLGLSFSSPAWIKDPKDLKRGDIFYICSDQGQISFNGTVYKWTTWTGALNGHVGILRAGAGDMWLTAEGGGSPGGTMCRLSQGAKNIRQMSKKFQGVWRPDLLVEEWQDIKPGMRGSDVKEWQSKLLAWRPGCLPQYGADGVYGTSLSSETLLATRAFQSCRGLPATGVVDRQTWDA